MNLYDDLMWRGLIKDVAGEDLPKKLNDEKITFYWGTDPTADSLHLGHYSSLVTAKRLMKAGHHPILLIGGATGLIGDPRPTSEREIIEKETVLNNVKGITKQVESLFRGNVEIVNNYDWTKDISFLDFLRDIGKYVNINYLLNKDIIHRRLETGITFAEFSYTLLQGNDFLHLFKNKNCIMQVEGSDQWGNITTGIELIKKKLRKEAYGFTMPLILDKMGKKFGKSEGNALWLDKNKTSSYELYQYLINTDDEMVIHYLKVFTFLTRKEIEDLEEEMKQNPEMRSAQKALAREIITDLHGREEFDNAVKMSQSLFSGNFQSLKVKDILTLLKDVPNFLITKECKLIDLLINNHIVSSKREARELISGNAILVNGEIINDENHFINKEIALEKELIVIRRGKKKYFLGRISF